MMMKKRFAVIMTAAMLTGIMAATALAESTDTTDSTQMSAPQFPGGEMPQMNGQAPEMNGEAPQMNGQEPETNGEMPQMNGQAPEMNGEAPQMNGQAPEMNGEAPKMNGEAPQMNGQMPQMNGNGGQENFGVISFENYVTDGTISQDTLDAITKYMEENQPELPTESDKTELAEGEKPELDESERPDLLKDLLEAGVITQEEYDALAAAREAERPELPENAPFGQAPAGQAEESSETAADDTDTAA